MPYQQAYVKQNGSIWIRESTKELLEAAIERRGWKEHFESWDEVMKWMAYKIIKGKVDL